MIHQFPIYRSGVSSSRYTALRTTSLSATSSRTVEAIVSSSLGGAGGSRRIAKYYAQKQGMSAKMLYKKFYPGGIIVL